MYPFPRPVERINKVDVRPVIGWILDIPLTEWHQQNPPDKPLKPSMLTDLSWNNFGRETEYLLANYRNTYQRMLSVVMPGDKILPHVDEQDKDWMYRVHIPLLSNNNSKFVVDGKEYKLEPGWAYAVNTTVPHAVYNNGKTPRIHFMFDVK